MSKFEIETVGETLGKLQDDNSMQLRKLATIPVFDKSSLSIIMRNERRAKAELINMFSKISKVDNKNLQICLTCNNVANKLLAEEYCGEILKVA